VIRIAVVYKLIKRNIEKRLHPRAMVAVKMSGKPISAETVSGITVFVSLFLIIYLISIFIISFEGMDMESTLSSGIAIMSNTGIGFGEVGFSENFNNFSPFGRVYVSLLMIVGRLELFTIVLLFIPSFWRPNN
jgi:trk system potassium uptake protein TrkH